LFAQELGTAEAVSTVKLDRVLAEVAGRKDEPKTSSANDQPKAPGEVKPSANTPIVAAKVSEKKSGPLKSLGALDALFRRG
jgi:hypothetical protein